MGLNPDKWRLIRLTNQKATKHLGQMGAQAE